MYTYLLSCLTKDIDLPSFLAFSASSLLERDSEVIKVQLWLISGLRMEHQHRVLSK